VVGSSRGNSRASKFWDGEFGGANRHRPLASANQPAVLVTVDAGREGRAGDPGAVRSPIDAHDVRPPFSLTKETGLCADVGYAGLARRTVRRRV